MRWMLAAGLLASVAVGVSGQSAGLADALQQMNDAAAKGDKVAYSKFLSEDVTWIDRAGRVRNKTAILAELQPCKEGWLAATRIKPACQWRLTTKPRQSMTLASAGTVTRSTGPIVPMRPP